jgi:hypothetical protein
MEYAGGGDLQKKINDHIKNKVQNNQIYCIIFNIIYKKCFYFYLLKFIHYSVFFVIIRFSFFSYFNKNIFFKKFYCKNLFFYLYNYSYLKKIKIIINKEIIFALCLNFFFYLFIYKIINLLVIF